ncbi:hypothetical protein [Candidatus Hodgkinia cicadicola]|uniref:hypothetical protein n=1 Tax=Candidatus Hodgkinia cicadicola TaxID=573658 RepID=UPI0011BAAC3E
MINEPIWILMVNNKKSTCKRWNEKILIKDINITITTTTKRWSELVYTINTLDVIYCNLVKD